MSGSEASNWRQKLDASNWKLKQELEALKAGMALFQHENTKAYPEEERGDPDKTFQQLRADLPAFSSQYERDLYASYNRLRDKLGTWHRSLDSCAEDSTHLRERLHNAAEELRDTRTDLQEAKNNLQNAEATILMMCQILNLPDPRGKGT